MVAPHGRALPSLTRRARGPNADAPHSLGLLRARRERPGGRCTAQQRDERAAVHSITSSARASSAGGTMSRRALAVRTGETKGRREYACAPERACAVFLLARIRHWNCDRGCEPTQLVERPNRDLGGQSSASRAYPPRLFRRWPG